MYPSPKVLIPLDVDPSTCQRQHKSFSSVRDLASQHSSQAEDHPWFMSGVRLSTENPENLRKWLSFPNHPRFVLFRE